MAEEIDDIAGETAAIMKQLLTTVTLVREASRRQREAHVRNMEKVRELQKTIVNQKEFVRATGEKVRHGLTFPMAVSTIEKAPEGRAASVLTLGEPTRTRTTVADLVKERDERRSALGLSGKAPKSAQVNYDPAVRRAALMSHLEKTGVSREVAVARTVAEIGVGRAPVQVRGITPLTLAGRMAEPRQRSRSLER